MKKYVVTYRWGAHLEKEGRAEYFADDTAQALFIARAKRKEQLMKKGYAVKDDYHGDMIFINRPGTSNILAVYSNFKAAEVKTIEDDIAEALKEIEALEDEENEEKTEEIKEEKPEEIKPAKEEPIIYTGKTNAAIIEEARTKMVKEGIIKEAEEINTYHGWIVKGYKVKRGERAITKLKIWRPYKKKTGEEAIYKGQAAFFSSSQVEKA